MIVEENTPGAWDAFWSRGQIGWGARLEPVYQRAAEILRSARQVHEYGFGNPRFARKIGRERWRGHDWSEAAVAKARAEGFMADRQSCLEAPRYRWSSVCAFCVLSYLAPEERRHFLFLVRNSPLVVFGDHLQGFGRLNATDAYVRTMLEEFWPAVDVERLIVGIGQKVIVLATGRRP